MKLSIIMPVYNESATIREVVRRVAAVPLHKEIILVDDCSTDGTSAILNERWAEEIPGLRQLRHATNRGKGAAIQTGLGVVSGDVVVIQDADLEYDPQDLPRLLAPIVAGQAQVVYGVRNFEGQRWYMHLGNRLITLMTNVLYGVHLRDMETCYKMMTRRVTERLHLESHRFDVEAELTAKILRQGYTIHEVPIRYQARRDHKKLTPLDGLPTLQALIRYRFWQPPQTPGSNVQTVKSEASKPG